MRAQEHTEAMLTAWSRLGVTRADLAVRRQDGAMLWQRDCVLEDLPLAWVRAENAHRADIYARPARGYAWAVVFLDDVPLNLALEVATANGGLAIRTSPEGGCHLWLPISGPLDEEGRSRRQKWLAQQLGADPASTSGEHLGRLAGFRNWKRGGCWVNVLCLANPAVEPQREDGILPDRSPSGQEWGWVCRMLEGGADPETVYAALLANATARRGADAERYARRTVERATEKVRQRLG